MVLENVGKLPSFQKRNGNHTPHPYICVDHAGRMTIMPCSGRTVEPTSKLSGGVMFGSGVDGRLKVTKRVLTGYTRGTPYNIFVLKFK